MKEFKEESYSMIMSRPIKINLSLLKKGLNDFVGQNLNRLLESPIAFPTELFRFFLKNHHTQKEKYENYNGNCFTIENKFPKNVVLKKSDNILIEQANKTCKTLLVKVIDDKYFITATRTNFFIYYFSSHANKVKKSKFLQQEKETQPTQEKLKTKIIFKSSEISKFTSEVKNSGFHCIYYLNKENGNKFLLFGGNYNVSSI